MIRMSLRHLRTQRRQLLGIALAISLSVAFLIVTQMVGSTLRVGLHESVGRNFQHIDLALAAEEDRFYPDDLAVIANLPGVAGAQPTDAFGAEYQLQGARTSVQLTVNPQAGALRDDLTLDRGEWATGTNQVVLHQDAARSARVDVGDTIDLHLMYASTATPMTVTGLWSGAGHFGVMDINGFVAAETWASLFPEFWLSGIYVTFDDGANPQAVLTSIDGLDLPTFATQTRDDLIDAEMANAQTELAMLNTGITGFGLLTIVVATLVVSNTFAILITQRQRDIALLRCAGATASQVRRLVLTEAVFVGVLASVCGIVLSWVAGWGVLAVIQGLWSPEILPGSPTLPASAPFVALLAGVALAVAAAWVPSRTAMRIDPLIALRAAHEVDTPLSHRARTAFGLLCGLVGGSILLAGAAISWNGNPALGTVIGIAGGTVTFAGVILCASVIVPLVARLLGTVTERLGGVPARVAATNAIRNPRRTTATAIALVIGVTLVTMMAVGAESLRMTLLDQVVARVPVDYQLVFTDEADDATRAAFIDDLVLVDGLAGVATFSDIESTLIDPVSDTRSSLYIGTVDPAALDAVWRDRQTPLGLAPNVVVAPGWVFDSLSVQDGANVTLEVGGTSTPVDLVLDERLDSPLVMAGTDANLPSAGPSTIWLRFGDGADREEVVNAVYGLADQHGVLLAGLDATDDRETLENILDTMLLVVVGLLAVAIVISLIGVSNTLSLSVLERTRESALLRALGFTRRQLRQSLALEGLLLAAIGASIGIVLGVAYGWIGTVTLVGDAFPPVIAVPWGRLVLVVVVALGCGLLASVLPARRAATADPVVALADQ
jgi:putative ABC transport system permease protein